MNRLPILCTSLLAAVLTMACTTPGPPQEPTGGNGPEQETRTEEPPRTAELQMAQNNFDQDFRLTVGEKVMVSNPGAGDESLEIRFDGVTDDSRCPRGVECFWEGEAQVELTVHQEADGGTDTAVVIHTASSRNPNVVEIPGGWVKLVSLSPYPAEGIDLDPAEYVATLRVSADEPEADGPARRRAPNA